jgi:hypothetical protein
MSPSIKKANIDVYAELQRLYFIYKKDKSGKDCLQLQTKDSIEEAERVKSFLIDLYGGFTKKTSISIEIMEKNQVFIATLKVKDIPVISQKINLKLAKLYYSERNFEHVHLAAYIQENMALVQK